MFKFAPYVLKSLLRHRARTLLTVSGSAVALFVFAFIGAAQQGMADMTRGQQAERTLIVFQANRFCPFTSRLPEDYADTIRNMPAVKDVLPMQVYMNNCRASLDLVLFHGVPPEKLKAARHLKLVAGDMETFERQTDAALVGRQLARRRGLSPGQKFSIGDVTVTVASVFAADTPAEEHLLYCPLRFLQRRGGRDAQGQVTQHEVSLNDDADPEAVARQIDATFRNDRVVTDTKPKGVFQASIVGDLAELIGWANYLGYACVGLVLAVVATTTVMAVQDRVREHAVLRAIGYSGPRVFGLVLSEGTIVSLAGGAVGVGTALVVLWWTRLAVGTEGVTIALAPSLTPSEGWWSRYWWAGSREWCRPGGRPVPRSSRRCARGKDHQSTSHTTIPLLHPAATVLPSGEKAMSLTLPLSQSSAARSRPEAVSQMRTRPSREPPASSAPPRENATASTFLVNPPNRCGLSAVSASHTHTDRDPQPATRGAVGDHTTRITCSNGGLRGVRRSVGGSVWRSSSRIP
jgi:putative ABC transport system permease protein